MLRVDADGSFDAAAVAHVRDRIMSVGGQVTVSGERLSASVPVSGSAR